MRGRQEHAEKCTAERCASGCGIVQFEDWLDAPVTAVDRRADQARKARMDALLRGQIPA